MTKTYHVNLFELKRYKPLRMSSYIPVISPDPEKNFYRVLGRLAKKLTRNLKAAVISHEGKIKALESEIPESLVEVDLRLEEIGNFKVRLEFEETQEVSYAEDPRQYGRVLSKVIDLALVHLSEDYFKYSELSPWVIERGAGSFPKKLQEDIGIEDGKRYYRGLRTLEGFPCLIINRQIELRSWKNLLNELKVLAKWWSRVNRKEETVDFYEPPEEFVKFVNWAFRGRSANVAAYSSRSIRLNEITWEHRAKDPVLLGGVSPCEYHKQNQGIIITDENQPLVKWTLVTKEGERREQFHIPELLVIGHTFDDLSMRTSKAQRSQVFDMLHPNCNDHQRKVFDLVRKIDSILREELQSVYPSKVEISVFPKEVTKNITRPPQVGIKFADREVQLSTPYGMNFYRRYPKTAKFISPISGKIKTLVICDDAHREFVEALRKEFERRNGCEMPLIFEQIEEIGESDFSDYDLVLTVTNEDDKVVECKQSIQNRGIAHQNVTPKHAKEESIPQLAMQLTLKLGGSPWFLKDFDRDLTVISVYSYRNPFSGLKMYFFNVMNAEGKMEHQSPPYKETNVEDFLREVHEKAKQYERVLFLSSFIEQQVSDYIIEKVTPDVKEVIFISIREKDQVRLFQTFKPAVAAVPRRRRVAALVYPIEAYESAPQGTILSVGENQYYILTTASTKIGTYYRGCPTPIRLTILFSRGVFDMESILNYILSLSLLAGTSGHETRLPAPLYYLSKYAAYVSKYGEPSQTLETIFYI
jgi:hypothetical protein